MQLLILNQCFFRSLAGFLQAFGHGDELIPHLADFILKFRIFQRDVQVIVADLRHSV